MEDLSADESIAPVVQDDEENETVDNDDDHDNSNNDTDNNNNDYDTGINHNEMEKPQQDSEDEDECRVCRGPAEDGNPLFSPCKCSGSIGSVHQECLVSWLEVTRGDGRCELCHTKFRFDPQYAGNTPVRLPTYEVILGLSSRFVAKWLPLAMRIALAIACWLMIAPFLTACLYHGWMHRPSSILARYSTTDTTNEQEGRQQRQPKDLIASDIVSGAIIAAFVIIGFLSIMSFADFLRAHWQQQQQPVGAANANVVGAQAGRAAQRQQRRRNGRNNNNNLENNINNNNDDVEEADEGQVDEIVMDRVSEHRYRLSEPDHEDGEHQPDHTDDTAEAGDQAGSPDGLGHEARGANGEIEVDRQRLWNDRDQEMDDDELDSDYSPDDESSSEEDDEDGFDEEELDHAEDEPAIPGPPRAGNGGLGANPPFDPLDPIFQDDQADMEINVALDELLGIRGPPSTLIRNLLWLLAFNATYLGLFAFVPRIIGSAVYVGIFNTTSCAVVMKAIPYMYSEDGNATTVYSTITAVHQVSEDLSTTFQLPDIATIILGYFAIAFMMTVMLFAWRFSQILHRRFSLRNTRRHNIHRQPVPRNANWEDIRRRVAAHDLNEMNGHDAAANPTIGVAFLDSAVAVVKVGVLLFLKMFALPQILGLALDASTLSLFGHTLADRVYFAGSDLFSFILLHWVAGITFMLLVTVFLLQLREVMHPDILARVIRPQEPHPDLLGNLMTETVATHIKRMLLSLAIYAPILLLHVTLPVQVLLRCGSMFTVPFYNLNFWHAMKPELQIPLELIIFHLSMLALLEKYKNTIGQLQHNWLTLVCGALGLTDYMLARSVEMFQLVGTRSIIHVEGGVLHPVDQFWYDLAKQTPSTVEGFVEGKITMQDTAVTREATGEAKSNGQRVYNRKTKSIRLPGANNGADDTMLPTAIGPYRLNVQEQIDSTVVVEFWREVRGETIARPPEGWDDLGAGGAFVQGRWAWGHEKPSVVERGVAIRKYFAHPKTQKRPTVLTSKVVLLLVLGWIAVVCAIFSFVSVPLLVGRLLYFLFRVDTLYVHDPFAFVMGGCLVFPGMTLVVSSIKLHEGNLVGRLIQWARAFRMPPNQKFLVLTLSVVLWCFIAPLALGLSYELTLVKASIWFHGASVLPDFRSLVLSWMAGSALLNTWAFLAYFSVFTRQFWSNVGNGMLEPPVDDNGNPLPPRNPANELIGSRTDWQGKQGRVAQFFGVWKAAIVDWDWEKVDKTCLLVEFAIPISRQLTSSLVGSMVSFILLLNVVPFIMRTGNGKVALPFLGEVERGFFRQLVFRSCMVSHIIVQLCSSFRGQLELWFESAHNSAKDARYLVGEVLMNYDGRI